MAEKVKNNDYVWLHVEHPTNLMVINGFLEFDEPLSYDRLCETVENRMLVFDRFKKHIVSPLDRFGPAYWKAYPHFDLRYHVRRIGLPSPGGKAELQQMVSDLMIEPLDQTKPLWRMYLVENYGKGCVLLVRLHHCVGDGISLIHVLLSITDPNPDTPPTVASKHDNVRDFRSEGFYTLDVFRSRANRLIKSARKMKDRLSQEGSEALAHPDDAVKKANKVVKIASNIPGVLARLATLPPDPHTVLKGELGIRKAAVWSEQMPLADIKKIGKALGATLNDVLVSAVVGALRHYLQTKGNPVDGLELRMLIPVSVRPQGNEDELGNKVSLVFLDLPVYIEDAVGRLKETKRRLDEMKVSPEVVTGFMALSLLGMTPVPIAKRAGALFANKASAVMSNVPGPRNAIYLAGTKVKNMMFWAPRTGRLSLGLSIISYNDQVTLGVAVDEGLVPDPEVILEGFMKEYAELKKAMKGKTLVA